MTEKLSVEEALVQERFGHYKTKGGYHVNIKSKKNTRFSGFIFFEDGYCNRASWDHKGIFYLSNNENNEGDLAEYIGPDFFNPKIEKENCDKAKEFKEKLIQLCHDYNFSMRAENCPIKYGDIPCTVIRNEHGDKIEEFYCIDIKREHE